jgi:aminoglycoside 3-N-acetyltransferase
MYNVFDESDFMSVLENVIPQSSDVVVIYPAIWTFAHLLKKGNLPANEVIFSCIDRYIGKNKTLIYPSFCAADFLKTKVYDITRTAPKESGVLPTMALNSGQYRRTENPMHSYLVKGRKENEVLSIASTTAWGDDSILSWFQDINATICPLGLPWHKACSLFHRAEEILQVPYRYYKKFNGSLYDNGKYIRKCSEVKYSYPLSTTVKFDHSVVTPILEKKYKTNTSHDTRILFQSANAQDIVDSCMHVLSEDIYAYVSNKSEAIDWVENKKEKEISRLFPSERYAF